MPRIAEARPAAAPNSPNQRARYRRILRVAADLAAENGLERVQMQNVAKGAGVAIGTLYRYFPSKTHLFTGVMAEQVDRLDQMTPPPGPDEHPPDAVAGLLVRATRHLLARPALATAMVQSDVAANAAGIPEATRIDRVFHDLVLRTMGVGDHAEADVTAARLLVLCWHGILTSTLNGRTSLPDTESDIHAACGLLLAGRSHAREAPA